ncbi:MAG: YIP1 family protein [Candidatus Marsarchaeota archaeon]|nr:YIP1 family protein [Candidatus Marsarchaeota archaeon]MCL5112486.1 YIP1 family protein [Candidatus Marsarchaeota archaeon]
MSYQDNLKNAFGVLLHPGKETKRQMGIGESLKFYYSVMIIPMILGIILGAVIGMSSGGAVAMISAVLLDYVIVFPIVSILVGAGIYHAIIGKLFKLYKGNYERVVNAFTYMIIPFLLIYWIVLPLSVNSSLLGSTVAVNGIPSGVSALAPIGLLLTVIFGIWALIVSVIALSTQLNISRVKAFGTMVLEGVIIGIIYLVVVLMVTAIAL